MTVWLNTDAYTALQLLVASQHADASTVISDAIRHYHAVTSDKPTVTSDVTSNKPAVTGNRYMLQALEDHILVSFQDKF